MITAADSADSVIDVPAGVGIDIGVALSNSTSSADAIATFPVQFADGGTYVLVAGGVVIAEEGSFTTATVLLPLLGAGLGWLVGATIASLPETVVKHRHGGPWIAEERMLVQDRLPLRCDPAP